MKEFPGIRLITDEESLPPLERTFALTQYKGHLPVIIFSVEERRAYFGYGEVGWPGFAAAKEMARAHFKANPKCHRIAVLMMNEPDAAAEATFEGSYRRSDFEKGGIYEAVDPAYAYHTEELRALEERLSRLHGRLHPEQLIPALVALADPDRAERGEAAAKLVKALGDEVDALEMEAGITPASGNVGMIYFSICLDDLVHRFGENLMSPAYADTRNLEAYQFGARWMTQSQYTSERRARGLDPVVLERRQTKLVVEGAGGYAAEQAAYYTHDCPDCRFIGVYFANDGKRFDLYVCKREAQPTVAARCGNGEPAGSHREIRHVTNFNLYHTDHALRRAAELAREQGLIEAEPPAANQTYTENAMSFSIDPNYTREELVAHFADPKNDGFTATSCGACGQTGNIACYLHQMGWGCPNCGQYNVGHFSGGYMIPHEQPDFGPTRAQIAAAAEDARTPETVAALVVPAHLRTVIIAAVDDLRDERDRRPLYEKGVYVLAPKEFPSECTLTVSVSGICYATCTLDDAPQMYPAWPARSPEAATLLFNGRFAPQHLDRGEVAALLKIVEEQGDADRNDLDYVTRAVAVWQETGTGSQDIQLAFALAAAARLGLRTMILFRPEAKNELAAIALRAHEINPDVSVGYLTYETALAESATSRQLTLAVDGGLHKILCYDQMCPSDLFDIVIATDGYKSNPEEARKGLCAHFRRARLVALWTSKPPSDEILAEAATTTGAITTFDAKYLQSHIFSKAMIDRDFRPVRAVARLFTERQPAEPFETFDRSYRQGMMRAPRPTQERLEHPYNELPPPSELKVATISTITRSLVTLDLDPGEKSTIDIPADETVREGMYILVPPHFPSQCQVVHTILGHFARMESGNAEEKFHVWPAATVAETERRYESARTECKIIPELIGSKSTRETGRDSFTNFEFLAPPDQMLELEEPPELLTLSRAEEHETPKPPPTRYTVSGLRYEEALKLISALEAVGIYASITVGGVDVCAGDRLEEASDICRQHGATLSAGDTTLVQYQEARRAGRAEAQQYFENATVGTCPRCQQQRPLCRSCDRCEDCCHVTDIVNGMFPPRDTQSDAS